MSSLLVRRAEPGDLGDVLRIIHGAAEWLHGQGYDQWPHDSPTLSPAALGAQIGRREMWLACTMTGATVATIAVSPDGDPDFWSPAELAQPAWYVAKMAIDRARAGRGLGALLLRWVLDRASVHDVPVARLDVWKTNTRLQHWYLAQGWKYLRTVDAAGRNSGALFEHPAGPDLVARLTFAGRAVTDERMLRGPLAEGARIVTDAGDQGTVVVVQQPRTGHEVTEAADAYPMRAYWARMDSGKMTVLSDTQVDALDA